MEWKKERILVTGAGGFIGSHLCEELLRQGASVTAMVRYTSRNTWGFLDALPASLHEHLQVVAGNIEDAEFVRSQVKNKDYVFHLAALIGIPYSYVAPQSYLRTNIEGTLNVLEAARQFKVKRVVHTSTSESYGTALYLPMDEKHPLQAQSPYAASKIAADKLAESYYRSFETPVSILRPFNTYGPRQSARAIIPTVITQALASQEIKIGNPSPVRDLVFVKDTVKAFILNATSEKAVGKVIHTGTGSGISVGDLAKLILKILKVDKPIVCDEGRLRPENSEVFQLIADPRQAKEIMGWQATTLLEDGLSHTIDFVRNNLSAYRPNLYNV